MQSILQLRVYSHGLPKSQQFLIFSCSYIGPEFAKVLEKSEVEYRQVNLTVPGAQLIFFFFLHQQV